MISSVSIIPCQMQFKKPARTSRGVYTHKTVYYIVLQDADGRVGVGEAAPLFDLSADYNHTYEARLREAVQKLEGKPADATLLVTALRSMPSVCFAVETACVALGRGYQLFDSPFVRGEQALETNGLIWMADHREMLAQIKQKLEQGFRCIKLKVGAIDLADELDLVARIRRAFSPASLELRLDANGAFDPSCALDILEQFAAYHIHSIEQPIRAGQPEMMAPLIASSPIPIALDEELIGCFDYHRKAEMLRQLNPHYIILKPTLHGGLCGCDEWVSLAHQQGIGWWATSALESNIGLNAIAQWVATYQPTCPQGLGTGLLFERNVPAPVQLRGSALVYDAHYAATLPSPVDAIRLTYG